jgi:hypothetical protein
MDPAEEWARDRGVLPPLSTRGRDHLIGCALTTASVVLMASGLIWLGSILWRLISQ